jgi:hypothetical protein
MFAGKFERVQQMEITDNSRDKPTSNKHSKIIARVTSLL